MYYFVLRTMAWYLSYEFSSTGQAADEAVILDLHCMERDSEVCLLFLFSF